jgi:hypothetical protein
MEDEHMRDLSLEAAIWNLFVSPEFFEAAARECEETMTWFGSLAISRQVANFGRNNQIFDTFKALARDFRRGAKMARLGDYKSIWDTARCVSGDVRGMFEQPLHSWMTEGEYEEFSYVRTSRLLTYARQITHTLNNAMIGADSFFEPDPDCPERSQDDDGFPGGEIVEAYNAYINQFKDEASPKISDPLPEYVIDRSIVCRTGDEVPWTGIWYPSTGVERRSLAFAIKGLRMQPAYTIVKTIGELESESDGVMFFSPQTVAEATTWHPMILSGRQIETNEELRAKAGEPCPKAGIWQPMDPGAPNRAYEAGETMANLGSAYGITVWQWIADR